MKSVLTGLLCSLLVLSGCASVKETAQTTQKNQETEITEVSSETKKVIDQIGRSVEVPTNPQRVVITFWPMGSAYTLFKGSSETIVGVDPNISNFTKKSLLSKIDPEVLNINSDFMSQDGVINEEALLALDADLALINKSATDQLEVFEKLNIPTLVFDPSIEGFNPIATFLSWMDLLGEAFNSESKAKSIADYSNKIMSLIEERTKDLTNEQKPKAMILFNYNESLKRVPATKHFGKFELEKTGAINVAGESDGNFVDADMEQIYQWNPEVIYIATFSSYTPEDLYNNTAANGDDWSGVDAIKNKRVYKYPMGIFHWYPPSADTPLALLWLAKTNNPELFEDIDFEAEIKSYYQDIYNITLTDEDIAFIMSSGASK